MTESEDEIAIVIVHTTIAEIAIETATVSATVIEIATVMRSAIANVVVTIMMRSAKCLRFLAT